METVNLKLSSPWVIYYRELNELFKYDKDIKVSFDEDLRVIRILVDNDEKWAILDKILTNIKVFGNVSIMVDIIPANNEEFDFTKAVRDNANSTNISMFARLFADNPILSYIKTISGVFTNDIHYIVFKKEVVQFFADNLGDINGQISTLYETIARDVFGDLPGICFCTDSDKMVFNPVKNEPVVNWPLK